MVENFQANALPLLIGSLPMGNHEDAVRLVLNHTPEIPLWVQLPVYREEGMIFQFMPGLPGLNIQTDKAFINTARNTFDDEMLRFYEDYIADTEGKAEPDDSRFALKADTARGFFTLAAHLKTLPSPPIAVKAQINGPITFCTAVKNQTGRAIYYDEQMRDVAVKLLARKAAWQVRQLSKLGCPVIIFFDEPALAGFGSSEFISMSREEVSACFEEVLEAARSEGGITGIHVCANSDWSLILDSSADVVSFDAYSYFDKFMLYPDHVRKFMEKGKIIAWGIVPTGNIEDIEKETAESLIEQWKEQAGQLESLGIDMPVIMAHSLITPSCGTGSLSLEHATRVIELTKAVSEGLRKNLR